MEQQRRRGLQTKMMSAWSYFWYKCQTKRQPVELSWAVYCRDECASVCCLLNIYEGREEPTNHRTDGKERRIKEDEEEEGSVILHVTYFACFASRHEMRFNHVYLMPLMSPPFLPPPSFLVRDVRFPVHDPARSLTSYFLFFFQKRKRKRMQLIALPLIFACLHTIL